jgi:hypothetical protein
MKLKFVIIFGMLFLISCNAGATEKIWIPMGTPQVTPSAGTSVPTPQETPQAPGAGAVPGTGPGKDGHWIYTYPDGNPESEGDYVAGQKDGVWKYWREDGSEIRELEFKNGTLTGNIVLLDPFGKQVYFDHFVDLISKDLPFGFKVKAIVPYLIDLAGDGKNEIVLIARSDDGSQLLVLDDKGAFLDIKQIDGLADDFVFGSVKKGDPVCFGFDSSCALSGGVCNWEFDQWDGQKIKTVLQYDGWYGKSGPFTLPVFKDVNNDGSNEIVTDNGTFKWDEKSGTFKMAK